MPLLQTISEHWRRFQGELFPELTEAVGRLSERHRKLVTVLEFAPPEEHITHVPSYLGRPCADRTALARAFIAKAIWDLPTTRDLIDRLDADQVLRRLCGWPQRSVIPSEATFSRVFAEFAASELPARIHAALVTSALETTIVGHVSRDSTAIEAREKPEPKPDKNKDEKAAKQAKGSEGVEKTEETAKPKRRRGRPRKGEKVVKEKKRLDVQPTMSLPDMIADLPQKCDRGTKRNAKGHTVSWNGYKLHIDAADGGIPLGCILTSASTHDSQVAIPMAAQTGQRVVYLYELMDSAYDAEQIHKYSVQQGHVPIIDVNPRRNKDLKEALLEEARAQRTINYRDAAAVRYGERSTVERVNARLKDDFGGRHVRVRGPAKVFCHLMFGILALTVEQLQRLML